MIVSRAPLRITLGGGGTDFPSYYMKYGGHILGFAIDKYVYVVLHDTIDKKIRLKYSKNEVVEDVEQLENRVAAEALKAYGLTSKIEIATFADVPESSGLGGSSAFCVALVVALRYKLGIPLNKHEIYRSAYDIERVKAKQPGGMQDQFFAALGGAWNITLGPGLEQIEMVNVGELLPKLKLVYSEVNRENIDIASCQDNDTKRGDNNVLKSLRITDELWRAMRQNILDDNLDEVGRILHAHWLNKKRRSKMISCQQLDSIYERALANGAIGGKVMGLGGGGYFLFYVPKKLHGFETIPFSIDWEGGKVIYSS
jgi:D-glycero-alpha-D-manno-heptose-7-phosphate kinase